MTNRPSTPFRVHNKLYRIPSNQPQYAALVTDLVARRHRVQHTLIDRDDSLLIVIDAQPAFLDKLPTAERHQLLDYMCWLIVVVTEDIPRAGSVAPEIAQMLPATPETPIY